MKNPIITPTLPLSIQSNQYGAFPAKTYYYIVDANGFIFHQDKKWRSKCLIEMNKYAYRTESSALISLQHLTERFATAVTRRPGRPISDIPQKEKKHSYSVSLSENRRDELVKRFGNLTKALDSIQLETGLDQLISAYNSLEDGEHQQQVMEAMLGIING